jgi:hypothetical protein
MFKGQEDGKKEYGFEKRELNSIIGLAREEHTNTKVFSHH